MASSSSNEPVQSSPLYGALYPYARLFLRLLACGLAPRFTVTGVHHVPRRGGCLLTPNHLADADPPFLINATPRPLWSMAKRELFDIRVLGPLLRFGQAFPVEPGESDRAALRRAEKLLKAGRAVVVFPEGRLSQDGELLPILPGAALLAVRANVPLVPVGIWGTQYVLPYGAVVPRPTLQKLHIHFGEPISLDAVRHLPKNQQREALAELMAQAIRKARAVARGEKSAA